MSIRWPLPAGREPARSRPTRAASAATAPSRPVTTSAMATPTFVGSPPASSGKPVIDIRPASAWRMKS